MTKKTTEAIKAFTRALNAETALASANRILDGYLIGLTPAEITEYEAATTTMINSRNTFVAEREAKGLRA